MAGNKRSVFDRRPSGTAQLGPMAISLWMTGRQPDGMRRARYAYRMWDLEWDNEEPMFEGKGFMPGAGRDTLEWKLLDLLSFLTLAEGDTDDEYFADYTPRQLAWRDARAEDLQLMVQQKEDMLEEAAGHGGPIPTIFRKQDWSPRDFK